MVVPTGLVAVHGTSEPIASLMAQLGGYNFESTRPDNAIACAHAITMTLMCITLNGSLS